MKTKKNTYASRGYTKRPPSPRVLIKNFASYTKDRLHPYYVTGFTDAESSFHISMARRLIYKTGWQVHARFEMHLHEKDRDLL